MIDENVNTFRLAERELMKDYGYSGTIGRIKVRLRFLRSWILHYFAYSSPHPGFAIRLQRARGVKIGKNCHLTPYVLIDLLFPHLLEIENNVAIGFHTMIFTHSNNSTNLFFKKNYPRTIAPVTIKTGVWINPGCIICAGVTIGENSIIAPGTIVTNDIPPYSLVMGNPGRVIKKLNE